MMSQWFVERVLDPVHQGRYIAAGHAGDVDRRPEDGAPTPWPRPLLAVVHQPVSIHHHDGYDGHTGFHGQQERALLQRLKIRAVRTRPFGEEQHRHATADLLAGALQTLDGFARLTSVEKDGCGLPNCKAEERHFCQLFLRHESERMWQITRQCQYVDQVLMIADEHI